MTLKMNVKLSLFLVVAGVLALGSLGCQGSKNPTPDDQPKVPVDPSLLSKETQEFQKLYAAELARSKDWSYQDLAAEYEPAPKKNDLGYDPLASGYMQEMITEFELTEAETQRIADNGFMVTERHRFGSMGFAYEAVFVKELPVLITVDSLLNAWHMSFDELLKLTEENVLYAQLEEFLNNTHKTLGQMDVGALTDAARC
jgi:hypothetical protein